MTNDEIEAKTCEALTVAGKEVQRITRQIVTKREELIVAKKNEDLAQSQRRQIETEIINLEDELMRNIAIISPRGVKQGVPYGR